MHAVGVVKTLLPNDLKGSHIKKVLLMLATINLY